MSILNRLGNIIKSRIPKSKIFKGKNKMTEDSNNNSKSRSSVNVDFKKENSEKDPVIADYYSNLELSYGAGRNEIHAAWKSLLKKYHPDLHSNDPEKQKTAHQLVQSLNKAYEELKKHLG